MLSHCSTYDGVLTRFILPYRRCSKECCATTSVDERRCVKGNWICRSPIGNGRFMSASRVCRTPLPLHRRATRPCRLNRLSNLLPHIWQRGPHFTTRCVPRLIPVSTSPGHSAYQLIYLLTPCLMYEIDVTKSEVSAQNARTLFFMFCAQLYVDANHQPRFRHVHSRRPLALGSVSPVDEARVASVGRVTAGSLPRRRNDFPVNTARSTHVKPR